MQVKVERSPGLDLLRAIAIVVVFCWHDRESIQNTGFALIGDYGWAGVDLFFVFSGYLIANQLVKPIANGQLPSLKNFYLKRSFRILPAYLFVVALYFLIPAWNEANGLPPLWKFLTFTQNFGLDRSIAGGFSHAWSLCGEEHFYLLLPTMVLFISGLKSPKWKTCACVASFFAIFLGGVLLRGTL